MTMGRRGILIFIAAFFFPVLAPAQEAPAPRNIQIVVQFRTAGVVQQGYYQSTRQSDETQFLVVTEGLEGRIFVGKQIPDTVWHRDFLRGEGHLLGETVFRNVGTSLIVRARIVGAFIEVTLTPEISYESEAGRDAVEVRSLSTTLRVADGASVEIGGAVRRSEFEDNFYRRSTGEALQIILTPRSID